MVAASRLSSGLKRNSFAVSFAEFAAVSNGQFGTSPQLQWDRQDNLQESWVSVYLGDVSINDDDAAKVACTREWVICVAVALKKVFENRVKKLISQLR